MYQIVSLAFVHYPEHFKHGIVQAPAVVHVKFANVRNCFELRHSTFSREGHAAHTSLG